MLYGSKRVYIKGTSLIWFYDIFMHIYACSDTHKPVVHQSSSKSVFKVPTTITCQRWGGGVVNDVGVWKIRYFPLTANNTIHAVQKKQRKFIFMHMRYVNYFMEHAKSQSAYPHQTSSSQPIQQYFYDRICYNATKKHAYAEVCNLSKRDKGLS